MDRMEAIQGNHFIFGIILLAEAYSPSSVLILHIVPNLSCGCNCIRPLFPGRIFHRFLIIIIFKEHKKDSIQILTSILLEF